MHLSKITRIVLASLLGAGLALAVTVMIVQSPALSGYIDERAIPALSRKLNRKIDVGKTDARIFPRPHVELTNVVVAGAAGEPPLLSAGRASAAVALWPFLSSFGKDIRISQVEFDDATVNLVRRPDGTLNYQDVARAFEPAPDQKSVEQREAKKEPGQTMLLDRLRVRRSQVTFLDRSGHGAKRLPSVAASRIDALVKFHAREAAVAICRANVFEGTVDLSGSTVDLSPPGLYHVIGRASQVDLGAILRASGAAKPPLDGHVAATVDLRGRGTTWPEMRPTLTGGGVVSMKDMALSPEVGSRLLSSIENPFSRVGLGGASSNALDPHWVRGGKADARFAIARGSIEVSGLQAEMPLGHASLGGQVGLDGKLALSGVASLAPDFVGQLTGAKLVPSSPLAVPIEVAGTLAKPKVQLKVDVASVAKDLEQLPGGLEREIRRRARLPHLPKLH